MFTVVYAFATSSMTHPLGFETDSTTVTRNLRILSEGVTVFLTALISASAGIVMWTAASSEQGIAISTWLTMSTMTSPQGLFLLFWWKQNHKDPRDLHRLWIIMRCDYRHYSSDGRLLFFSLLSVMSVLLTSQLRIFSMN